MAIDRYSKVCSNCRYFIRYLFNNGGWLHWSYGKCELNPSSDKYKNHMCACDNFEMTDEYDGMTEEEYKNYLYGVYIGEIKSKRKTCSCGGN